MTNGAQMVEFVELLLARFKEIEARVAVLEKMSPIINGKRWDGEDWVDTDEKS